MTFNDFTWQVRQLHFLQSQPEGFMRRPTLGCRLADDMVDASGPGLIPQLQHPVIIPWREKISYGLRLVFCFLTMESVLHTMYVVAIKDTQAWEGDSPADLSMVGFWNLVVVWLKVRRLI